MKTRLLHGLSKHPLFQTWYDAYRRCHHPQRKDYPHYGGRGIKFCEEWMPPTEVGFVNFLKDMEISYQDGLELERKDVNGNYNFDNCTWVTRRTQVVNRRPTGSNFDTKLIEYGGKRMCISEWADEIGIPKKVLVDRLGKLKWDVEKSLTVPLQNNQSRKRK